MVEEAAQAFDDRESKAKPAAAIRLRSRQLNELTEYVPLLFRRDAGSAVADVNAQLAAAAAAANHDPTVHRVAHGVRQQIEQNAFKENEIAPDRSAARHHTQPQPLFARGLGESCFHPCE